MTSKKQEEVEITAAEPTGLNKRTALALERLRRIDESVKGLDPTLKDRAVALLVEAEFGTGLIPRSHSISTSTTDSRGTGGNQDVSEASSFSSLVEKWTPSTQSEWALLAAYFVTKYQGESTVMGQSLNKILKHHGKGVANVTVAVARLADADPALMLQVKKAGTSRQARKSYKVTTLGMSFVEEKLKGSSEVKQ
jgi:hypothetical protein